MRLLILGGPGSGRGTQSELLCRHLNILWISTGDILRTAISNQNSEDRKHAELAHEAQNYVEQGELVPDNIMIEFIRLRLQHPDTDKGWILDGYPRTAFQAEELDFLLDELGQQLDKAIYLEVPNAVQISRSLARGHMDDQLDVVQRRVELFHSHTKPLLEYYEMRDRLLHVRGDQAIDQVEQDILEKLGVSP